MKLTVLALALAGSLVATTTLAQPPSQQMDPNMPGMQHGAGMQHDAEPAQAQGIGVVNAVDTAHGTITLQHQAIPSLGWPGMTMAFKASPEVLKTARVGETVQFTLHPAGMASTVTSVRPTPK